jgi:hypothetical protein
VQTSTWAFYGRRPATDRNFLESTGCIDTTHRERKSGVASQPAPPAERDCPSVWANGGMSAMIAIRMLSSTAVALDVAPSSDDEPVTQGSVEPTSAFSKAISPELDGVVGSNRDGGPRISSRCPS